MRPSRNILDQLAASGLTGAQMALVTELVMATAAELSAVKTDAAAEKRRAYDRDRKRNKPDNSTGIPPEKLESKDDEFHRNSTGIPPEPRAHVRDITSNSENNHNYTLPIANAVSDDWPEGTAQAHAKLICSEIASPWLDQDKSGGLVTTVGLLARWRRNGASWQHDVLPLIQGRMQSRRKPVTTWAFFNDAVDETIAANNAALKIPEAGTVIPFRGIGPPSIADRIADEHRQALEALLAMDTPSGQQA